ncbi:hypothetical protein ACF0H5_010501 [Mactra antiquata]
MPKLLCNIAIVTCLVLVSIAVIDIDKNCSEKFNSTIKDNIDVLRQYPRGLADEYMWKLGDRFKKPLKNEPYPVLTMALDRHTYRLSQGLFESFQIKVLSNTQYGGEIKVVVFDIGLTRRQKKVMQDAGCRCEIRKFQFQEFPRHIKNKNLQAWKPIMIMLILVEYGKVLWVDPSIRFKSRYLEDLMEVYKKYGVVFRTNPTTKLVHQTDNNLFKYLGEDTCKFQTFKMIYTDCLALYHTPESLALVKSWVTCAFNIDCIAPETSRIQNVAQCNSNAVTGAMCHHFEQSVFGVLARRIFHKHHVYPFSKVLDDLVYANATNDDVQYFEICGALNCYL